MLFDVFRIVRADAPQFTIQVMFIRFAQIWATSAETALVCANAHYPERRHHMAVEPAHASKR